MSYQKTVLRAWNENILFSALVELTYRCNLDCFFCYNDLSLTGTPMRAPDYARFFEDLKALSCLHLTLSGGEPLTHPDFFEIGARARELGFVVRLKSNGHALRGEMLKRVKEEVDPFVVEVSLHGSSAETHDRQTRIRGSFRRLMENLDAMKTVGLRVKLVSTLTRWNESEVEEMFAIAERLHLPLTVDPAVTPRDDGDRVPLEIAATAEGLRNLYRAQTRSMDSEPLRQGDGELPTFDSAKHCGAGSSGIAVDPFGNVYPCVQWRRAIGNLRETSILDIWTANERLEEVRALTVEVKSSLAKTGRAGKFLNFCPGAAEKETGNALEVPRATAKRGELFSALAGGAVSLPIYPG